MTFLSLMVFRITFVHVCVPHVCSLCMFLVVVDCNTINNCDLNAKCEFDLTTGNYQCRCLPGYSGDGFSCRVTGTMGYIFTNSTFLLHVMLIG